MLKITVNKLLAHVCKWRKVKQSNTKIL